MPVVSKGEFTVSRLDDGVSSHLHVGWKMADGTFSTVYPRENYAPNTQRELIVEDFTGNTTRQDLGTPYKLSDLAGKIVVISADVEVRNVQKRNVPTTRIGVEIGMTRTSGGKFYLGVWKLLDTNIGQDIPKQRIFQVLRVPNGIDTTATDVLSMHIQCNCDYGYVGKVKIEIIANEALTPYTPTIYTPAPSEDYLNAYPKWRGEYTDFTAADSTNPDDYTWTAYLGEQGPPTGVISQSTIPSSPYVGMLWQCTGNIAGYINPATYRWNGSAWEIYQFTAQNILAETFTGFTFQGVEFIGSKFVSEFDIPIGTEMGARAVGQTVIENGGMVTDMVEYLTDGDYDKHLEFSPNKGIFMTYKGRQTGDTQEAQLTPEGLRIKTPVAEAILSVATIYSLVRPARKNLTPANDVNRKGVVINYFRVGNLVNVAIKFELLKDTGWVALAPSPPSGYYPTSMYQASGVAGSVSYRGQTCMVYCNPDGLRLIPTTGQGTGEFQLSLTWTTNDPFPYGDS